MPWIKHYAESLRSEGQTYVPAGHPRDDLASRLGIIALSLDEFPGVPRVGEENEIVSEWGVFTFGELHSANAWFILRDGMSTGGYGNALGLGVDGRIFVRDASGGWWAWTGSNWMMAGTPPDFVRMIYPQ